MVTAYTYYSRYYTYITYGPKWHTLVIFRTPHASTVFFLTNGKTRSENGYAVEEEVSRRTGAAVCLGRLTLHCPRPRARPSAIVVTRPSTFTVDKGCGTPPSDRTSDRLR